MRRPYHLFKYNKNEGDSFTVIAHRGASAYFPENTLESFEGAISMGADMVELDVQLSRDGEVVVFHDEKLSRCTNSKGKISDYTLVQLKKLDAGSWFGKKFKGAQIPTLNEALTLCRDKIALNIEIKTEAVTGKIRNGIEAKCLQIVEKNGMQEHVVFSSFDPRALKHLKSIDSSVVIAALFKKKHYGTKLPLEIVNLLTADSFNCSADELNKKWLANIKANNIPVNIYTVNDKRNMRRFLKMGVNGIFTNKPDMLKMVLMEMRQEQWQEN